MALSPYDVSVPVFIQMLSSLSAILGKAARHAEEQGTDPGLLLQDRLYPDMFPLVRQVQVATDHAKGAAARLAGVDVPRFPDDETSVEALQARIARTIDFLQSLAPEQFVGGDERAVRAPVGGRPVPFRGGAYLLHFAIPNFYFHVTTAYAILRRRGVPIGKVDFIGSLILR
jgi:uncharacterized protein